MDRQPLDEDARARRRREARQRIRRRRWTAGLALVAVVAGVAAALAVTGASSSHGVDQTSSTTAAVVPEHHAATVPARAPEPASAASAPPGRPIPILMYHAIEAPPAGSALPELWVSADTFAQTMDALHDRGYHAISMEDAYDYWKGRRRVPRNPIVLTFDDGFRSQVQNAMPTLERLGWTGVLYLEVAALHTPGAEGIGRGGVRRLLRAGWELGSHTMTHPDLTTVTPDALREEVTGARTWLRHEFHEPVNSFCYPAGKYDDAVVAAVGDAGYVTATTVDPGVAGPGDLLRLPRIRVNASDGPDAVLQHLADAGAGIGS